MFYRRLCAFASPQGVRCWKMITTCVSGRRTAVARWSVLPPISTTSHTWGLVTGSRYIYYQIGVKTDQGRLLSVKLSSSHNQWLLTITITITIIVTIAITIFNASWGRASGKNQFLPFSCGKNQFLPLDNGKNRFLPLENGKNWFLPRICDQSGKNCGKNQVLATFLCKNWQEPWPEPCLNYIGITCHAMSCNVIWNVVGWNARNAVTCNVTSDDP